MIKDKKVPLYQVSRGEQTLLKWNASYWKKKCGSVANYKANLDTVVSGVRESSTCQYFLHRH